MLRHLQSLPRWSLALATLVVGVLLAALVVWLWRPASPTFVLDESKSNPVLLGAYLANTRETAGGPLFTEQSLANQPGRILSYKLTNVDAEQAGGCEVRWTSIDRRRHRPVAEGDWRYDDVLGWPNGLLMGAAVEGGNVSGELWVPLPGAAANVDRYFVRLRLLCDGQAVATFETPTYRRLADDQTARGVGAAS